MLVTKFDYNIFGRLSYISTEILDFGSLDENLKDRYFIEMEKNEYQSFEQKLLNMKVNGLTIEQIFNNNGIDYKNNTNVSYVIRQMFDSYRYAGNKFFEENGLTSLYNILNTLNKNNV